jgi:UDP-glucose 4-epimerase
VLIHAFENPRRPKRVVILGKEGFVPKALGAALSTEGVPTLALGRSEIDLLSPDAAFQLASILASDDVVVMTAAITPDKGRDLGTMIRNLRMAETVASAITSRNCGHIVYISSDAVYSFNDLVIDEHTQPAPSDLYGIMHLTREMVLKEAAGKAGIPFCILRSCAIYGIGDSHNSYGPNRFIRTALETRAIQLFGDGEETRDHIFIGDVVSVIKAVIERCSVGLLNMVGGQSVSFGSIAHVVAELVAPDVAIESRPRIGPITHRAFETSAMAEGLPELMPTPLAHGLDLTIATSRKISESRTMKR